MSRLVSDVGTGMNIPSEYNGREQSYLKHRILKEYLDQWGVKIGSTARQGPVKLWYVDCFAGPWKNRDQGLRDTSIAIGLQALEEAAATWRTHGHEIRLGAIFVEKDRSAYQQLQTYLAKRSSDIDIHPWHGKFGDHVQRIIDVIEADPAFVFVDPTGFKGVGMHFIAPLMRQRMRDVLVNVMFNDINRFKDDPRSFLRQQMWDFFGLTEGSMPSGLAENELMALYRRNLKRNCDVKYAADLAVPHPTHERTWFRLVIGGKHPKVLEVFRDAERKVIGQEAANVRTLAKQKAKEDRSGQLSLGAVVSPQRDRWYDVQNDLDCRNAICALKALLREHGRRKFGSLWPELLEDYHVTKNDIARLVIAAANDGELLIEPERRRRSLVRDDEWVSINGVIEREET
ncbi:MAG: three-Cys-motif partner protein TcmP [Proteobacteria bacterium]|nr:three-Cys-motif partner protein TcmP [Pseudomonadota bacterium]